MFLNMGPPELGIQRPLKQCLELAKTAGFEGIDIDIYEVRKLINERGANYVKDLFAEREMHIGGWIWFDHFGYSDDEAAFQNELGKLPSLAQAANEIGATRVLSWILSYSDELNYDQNFSRHVQRLKATMEILNDYRQQLALEYIAPKTFRLGHKHEFISTLNGALALIEATNARDIGLIMDSWHWYTSGSGIDDIKQLPAEFAIYVHLSDAPENTPIDEQIDHIRCLPGKTNVIDNVGFLRALHEIGYTGPVTAEPFSEDINALSDEDAAHTTFNALSKLKEKAGIK